MTRARTYTRFVLLAALLVAGLAVVAGPGAAQDDGEIDVAIEPNASAVGPGEVGTYEVVIEGPDSGISAYDGVVVDLSDPGVGSIVGFEEQFDEDAGFTASNSEIRNNNATLYLEAVTGESFAAPASETVVATFDVQAAESATDGEETDIAFDTSAAQTVADFENTEPYDVAAFEAASLTVSTLNEGQIDLAIEPQTSELEPGEVQSYEVIVEGADSGIGAYDEVEIDLSNPSVGDIVGFEEQFDEDAGFTESNSEIRNDNATLYLEAVTGESFVDPPGQVVIATFDLEALPEASDGDTTDIAFDSSADQTVADFENIQPYDVAEFREANMTVNVDFPPSLELASVDAPDYIQITDDLEVEYTIENTGDATGVESAVELVVELGGSTVEDADTDVSVPPDDPVSGTLVFDDFEGLAPGVTIEYTVRLANFGDNVSGTANITEGDPEASISGLDIAGQGAGATITAGDDEPISLDVTNVGNLSAEFEVGLTVYDSNFDPVVETGQLTAAVDPGDSDTVTFEGVTDGLGVGEYTVELVAGDGSSNDDDAFGDLSVEEPAPVAELSNLDIAGQGTDATIAEGADEPVAVDVTNVGQDSGSFEVGLDVLTEGGDRIVRSGQSTDVLAPGETESLVLEAVTPDLDPGSYTVEVTADDDLVSGDLTVEESQNPASQLSNLDVASQGSTATIVEGEDATIAVDVGNVGEGIGAFDVTLAVSTGAGGPPDEFEQTTGTLAPGDTGTVVFEGVTDTLDPDTYVLEVTTDDDQLSGEVTVEEDIPASLLSDLDIAGQGSSATLVDGESGDVTVDVTNILEAGETFDVTLQVGDATEVSESTELLEPGQSGTVTFADVGGDLEAGQYDVVVTAADEAVTGSLTVVAGVDVTGDGNLASDTTGDGLLNDIDGDGEFDIFDVQALFSNLNADVVQAHPGLFNFNGDDGPSEVTIFDVQGLFSQLQAS